MRKNQLTWKSFSCSSSNLQLSFKEEIFDRSLTTSDFSLDSSSCKLSKGVKLNRHKQFSRTISLVIAGHYAIHRKFSYF